MSLRAFNNPNKVYFCFSDNICKPCVGTMLDFLKLHADYAKNENLVVISPDVITGKYSNKQLFESTIFNIFAETFFRTDKEGVKMRFLGLVCFLVVSVSIQSQQVITGRITAASDGQPVVGAHIYIANTTVGTVSDISGDYRLTVPGTGSIEIIVSCVGYGSFSHKIDTPNPFHQLDVSLEIIELPEVSVTSQKTYRQSDVDLFWNTILGVKPTRRGLQVLNPEKVYFHLSSDKVLKAFCSEPVEIVNHEMGYHIRYVLQFFEHDYKTGESLYYGMPVFEELTPLNNSQKRRWDRRRQEVYAVSITRFMRALYRQNIHEAGFLLVKLDMVTTTTKTHENRYGHLVPVEIDSTKQVAVPVPLTDILQKDQVLIDSPLYLGCFSKPVTEEMIENSYSTMFERLERIIVGQHVKFQPRDPFPIALLPPQQFTIYPDGTYSGILRLGMIENQILGLSATTPLEYGLDIAEMTVDE